jgi:hypothetical protein
MLIPVAPLHVDAGVDGEVKLGFFGVSFDHILVKESEGISFFVTRSLAVISWCVCYWQV